MRSILLCMLFFLPAGIIVAETDKIVPVKTLDHPSKDVETVVFHPDGAKLYVSGWDNDVFIYDWPSGEKQGRFTAHLSAVLDLQFSKDGEFFMTASNDHTARLWRTKDRELIHTFSDHTARVNSAAISPDNRFIITASHDGKIYIYDRENNFERVSDIELHDDRGNYVGFEPQRGMILQATSRPSAFMLQPGSLNPVREFYHESGVNHIYITENGRRIITASSDQTAVIWDPVEDQKVVTLRGHNWRVLSGYIDKDGEFALTSSNDGTAKLWDVKSGEVLRVFEPDPPTVIRSAVFSPDLEYVITSGRVRQPGQKGVMIWESGIFDEPEIVDEETEENMEAEGMDEE